MRRAFFVPALVLASSVAAQAAAPDTCWALHKHGRLRDAYLCFEVLARSADAWFRAEGFWGLEEWDQANEQFRLATPSGPTKPYIKVRWGRLLHERFNDIDAANLFSEALVGDPS